MFSGERERVLYARALRRVFRNVEVVRGEQGVEVADSGVVGKGKGKGKGDLGAVVVVVDVDDGVARGWRERDSLGRVVRIMVAGGWESCCVEK